MIRTFKTQTVAATSTPQPLVGTTTAVAIVASPVPQSVQVADSANFRVGDRANIGAGAAGNEFVTITAIADGTHVTAIFTKNHNSGVFVQLCLAASAVYVQPVDGGSGAFYVGNSGSMTASLYVIKKLNKVASASQPNEWFFQVDSSNPEDAGEFWVFGTQNDAYNCYFGAI